ncbi:MAG: hypothetical protein EXR62_14905 [Chloroflexi bacterium]|nr:hypothetical protein [Chloroflexota bacterium]
MTGIWEGIFWIAMLIFPLWLAKRWINRHLQGVGLLIFGEKHDATLLLYFLILFPGIILHELSHWGMAHLLGIKTGKFSLGPQKLRGGRVRLGSVRVARADPLRESLIGAAPLIVGTLVILSIAALRLGVNFPSGRSLLDQLGRMFQNLPSTVYASDVLIWLYLIFAISNSMLPSESDRTAWLPLGLWLAAICSIVLVLGYRPNLPPEILQGVLDAINYLGLAFALTLFVDLIFMAVVFLVESALMLVSGRRVEYPD